MDENFNNENSNNQNYDGGSNNSPFGEYENPKTDRPNSPFGEYGGSDSFSGGYASSTGPYGYARSGPHTVRESLFDKADKQRAVLIKVAKSPFVFALAILLSISAACTAIQVIINVIANPAEMFSFILDLAIPVLSAVAVWLIYSNAKRETLSRFGFICSKVLFYLIYISSFIALFAVGALVLNMGAFLSPEFFENVQLTDSQLVFMQVNAPLIMLAGLGLVALGVLYVLLFAFGRRGANAATGLLNNMPFRKKPKLTAAGVILIVISIAGFVLLMLLPLFESAINGTMELFTVYVNNVLYGDMVITFEPVELTVSAIAIISEIINLAVNLSAGAAMIYLDREWKKSL